MKPAMRYHDGQQFRTAFIVSRARKWMSLLLIEDGTLIVRKAPLDVERTMTEIDAGARQARKMCCSLRRLAKKKGTSKKAREAVQEIVA